MSAEISRRVFLRVAVANGVGLAMTNCSQIQAADSTPSRKFTMALSCYQCCAASDDDSDLAAQIYSSGFVPLTRGSSTTIQNLPGQRTSFVTVLALGQGTLKATLSKKDTVTRSRITRMVLVRWLKISRSEVSSKGLKFINSRPRALPSRSRKKRKRKKIMKFRSAEATPLLPRAPRRAAMEGC